MAQHLAVLASLALAIISFFGSNHAASVGFDENTKRSSRQIMSEAFYNPFESQISHAPFPQHPFYNPLLFNNRLTINHFQPSTFNYYPVPLSPVDSRIIPTLHSCTSSDGENDGVCAPIEVCSAIGGLPDGSCKGGNVCCINTITGCHQTITVNNTYWRAPKTTPYSLCSVKVKVDPEYVGQGKPTCQVRLDFLSFNISQPDEQSVCSTDLFEVKGSKNKAPVICGENPGQHMYLHVPNSAIKPTDLKLTFLLGGGLKHRHWKIKVSYLPCDSNYLAPDNCLQYYMSSTGKIQSFNWNDSSKTSTRQLANQNYSICFRSELLDDKKAPKICYSVCQTDFKRAFSVSVANSAAAGLGETSVALQSQILPENCNNDYLEIIGGETEDATRSTSKSDKYCGEIFSAASAATENAYVCNSANSFLVTYHTNDDEDKTPTVDSTSSGNQGFCLVFKQTTD